MDMISEERKVKWWILVATICSTALIFYDMTSLPVALPALQREFLWSSTQLKWLINGYALTMALFVATSGKLSDHIGQKVVLRMGFFMFAISSALCAISNSYGLLIIGRVLQGFSGALLYPVSYTVLAQAFPANKKGVAIGINVCFGAIFISIGPFLGGLFTQYLSWRYIFWVNLPVAFLGLSLVQIFVARSKHKNSYFDYKGWFTFFVSFGALIFAIMQGGSWGWTSAQTLCLFAIAFIFFALLWLIEKKQSEPFLDFSLFKSQIFSAACFSTFVTQILLLTTAYWPIFFQQSLGFSIAYSGVLIMAFNIPVILGGPLGGWLLDRFDLRASFLLGFSLSVVAYVWMAFIPGSPSFWWFLPAIICWGIGLPSILSPAMAAGIGEADTHKQGAASGLLNTFRSCGAATGIALMGAIFTEVTYSQFQNLLARDPTTSALNANVFKGLLSKTSTSLDALQKLSTDTANQVQQYLIQASESGFFTMNLTCASIEFIMGVIAMILLMHRYRKTQVH